MKLKSALMGAAASLVFAPAAFAERGADGHVNVLYWQAPSLMNPYLSGGTKELEVASPVIEPLARFSPSGEMIPHLAEEIPTLDNGGFAQDLKSITWKLKKDIKWNDGSDFTADDVVFTWQYCTHPEGGCAQASKFHGVEKVEAIDPHTVKVSFVEPKPYPYATFSGPMQPILQKKQFENCLGTAAPTCTEQNFKPIGTGPFKVVDFKTNDVIQYEANPYFREADKPAFATMTIKGGGDPEAAVRAVLETGEFDYAWNAMIAPEVMEQMTAAGKGKAVVSFGTLVERIMTNLTNPSAQLPEGERATVKHPHPFMTDPAVRKALSMAIDRELLTEVGYGPTGKPTCDFVPAPEAYAANNTSCLQQDIEGANALLEEAGYKKGADGIREKDGVRLSILYQTSTNAVRQDFQSMIKDWWAEIGVETELKNVAGAVYFGSDPGSPDTLVKFYADVEMYANNFDGTDPAAYLADFTCEKIPGPDTGWQGPNYNRICSEEYDAMINELNRTADPAARQELAKKINNWLTVENNHIIPLVHRGAVAVHGNSLGGVVLNSVDASIWNVKDWHRVK
ncbi:peptide ABC transporter substrate-binding protein [Falsigemmobacter intermedius]|uniref:Peptide ABC transporter substrate-binding protein n=1 Tax=Falsigemmobacter intermedius TaxID=1553448 RepID=A0A444M9G5_9RHOB|nr:peptide ABC transporter substrate-binding protein [Falsigemmobacter intermedius]RWY39550.1 peptide ABC transporter substrate-binding protein [Falsigemmobacter intermedius]